MVTKQKIMNNSRQCDRVIADGCVIICAYQIYRVCVCAMLDQVLAKVEIDLVFFHFAVQLFIAQINSRQNVTDYFQTILHEVN
jgi:hypothetical protein